MLAHWGRATHICIGKLTIIGSDNGLSPGRRQAIIWTNAGILLTGTLGTNFSEILIGIQTFSFRKMHLKILSAKWRPFCLDLNELRVNRKWKLSFPVSVASVPKWCYCIVKEMAWSRRPYYNTLSDTTGIERKPPCISGMELLSLSCNWVLM